MRNRYVGPAGLAFALTAATILAAVSGAKISLEGKTFAAETGEKGKSAGPEKETISFKNGRFHSAACDQYGFGDAPYTAMGAADGSVAWTAETTSAKEGKIQWKGTVKGDQLESTYVWTKAGQDPIEYWLKGTAKK
jgi:hypothetical protein